MSFRYLRRNRLSMSFRIGPKSCRSRWRLQGPWTWVPWTRERRLAEIRQWVSADGPLCTGLSIWACSSDRPRPSTRWWWTSRADSCSRRFEDTAPILESWCQRTIPVFSWRWCWSFHICKMNASQHKTELSLEKKLLSLTRLLWRRVRVWLAVNTGRISCCRVSKARWWAEEKLIQQRNFGDSFFQVLNRSSIENDSI